MGFSAEFQLERRGERSCVFSRKMAILAAKTQNFFWLARRARGALRRYMGLRREGAWFHGSETFIC